MNKKVATGISIILGGVMMATTAFASSSSSSGYDIYKDAFKNTRTATSMTGTAVITVTDNSQIVLKSDDTIKMNRNTKNMSGSINITAGNQVKSMLVYGQNDQTVTKDNDSEVYNVLSTQLGTYHGSKKWGQEQENPGLTEHVENIVDLLAGNYQNYITLDSQVDGNKQVSLKMSGSQVTPIVNAVTSLVVREGGHGKEKKQHSFLLGSNIGDQIPKLVDDIRVTNIDVTADIDNQNFIKEQSSKITLTGKDAEGKNHEIVCSVDLNLSNLNNTTPDSVDLTGKQVKTIQLEDMEQFGHKR